VRASDPKTVTEVAADDPRADRPVAPVDAGRELGRRFRAVAGERGDQPIEFNPGQRLHRHVAQCDGAVVLGEEASDEGVGAEQARLRGLARGEVGRIAAAHKAGIAGGVCRHANDFVEAAAAKVGEVAKRAAVSGEGAGKPFALLVVRRVVGAARISGLERLPRRQIVGLGGPADVGASRGVHGDTFNPVVFAAADIGAVEHPRSVVGELQQETVAPAARRGLHGAGHRQVGRTGFAHHHDAARRIDGDVVGRHAAAATVVGGEQHLAVAGQLGQEAVALLVPGIGGQRRERVRVQRVHRGEVALRGPAGEIGLAAGIGRYAETEVAAAQIGHVIDLVACGIEFQGEHASPEVFARGVEPAPAIERKVAQGAAETE